MKDTKLVIQFKKLMKYPTMPRYLTVDLYEFISIRGGFIAHYDRNGFHKARFWTLRDFDHTITMMSANKELAKLLNSISMDELGWARFKVASAEASLVKAQAAAMQYHLEQLQSKFTKELI